MIRSTFTRISAVVIAVVVLASCRVQSHIALSVKPNGSGTVTVTVEADQDAVGKTSGLLADLRTEDLTKAGWDVSEPKNGAMGKKTGLTLVLTRSFRTPSEATAILAQVNGENGPLHNAVIERSGKDASSTWTLTGRLEVKGGLEAFADAGTNTLLGGAPYKNELAASGQDLGDAVGLTFSALLPGDIQATTGKHPDTATITWDVPLDGSAIDLATSTKNVDVASSVSRVGRVILKGLIVLWLVAMALLFLLVMNARNRRARTPRL